MNCVKIRVPESYAGMIAGRANFGIELSHWLRDQGLVREQDYTWSLDSALNTVTFVFNTGHESYASLFALRWAGQQ